MTHNRDDLIKAFKVIISHGQDVYEQEYQIPIEPKKPFDPIAHAHGDVAEVAYWEFAARRGGDGPYKGHPQSERDAFKAVYRQALQSCLDDGWMDIESAPKDGTVILAVVRPNPDKWCRSLIHWDKEKKTWYEGYMPLVSNPWKPTHWKKLDPTPPDKGQP